MTGPIGPEVPFWWFGWVLLLADPAYVFVMEVAGAPPTLAKSSVIAPKGLGRECSFPPLPQLCRLGTCLTPTLLTLVAHAPGPEQAQVSVLKQHKAQFKTPV